MKNIKLALSMAVLLGTLTVVGMSSSRVAFANEGGGGSECNCQYTSGALGVIVNGTCNVEDCWVRIN